ncbi:MAG: DUF4912 domain-containing protein [Nitrospirae bacterium]|nr:DUF4912 domain-containing protein [Nitrospirota bacterium]
MKTKDPKKKSSKTSDGTKTVKVAVKSKAKAKAEVKAKVKAKPKAKVSKVPAVKPKPAVKAEKKTSKKKTIVAKVAMKVKAEAKSKAKAKAKAEVKAKVKAKPKAKVSKVPAVKPKPAVKTEKKTPKKKTIVAKVAMKVKAEAKSKAKAEVKAKVKAKPKAKVSKVPEAKPVIVEKTEKKAMAAKKEPAVPVRPSLKSVAAANKNETVQEARPEIERYPARNSKANLKIFLPEQNVTEEEAEEIFFGGLPEEYGENAVIALAVDPNTVFVDWEVIPKDISDKEGELNLRFYDITGIEFNDWNANAVLDVLINKRVGSGFFDIHMPGRDVVVAVGILSPTSGFMPIVRSDMVSFPELLAFDELGIVQKLFESGIPVGY